MKNLIRYIFATGLLCSSASLSAHDPGLSFAEITIQKDRLTAQLAFAIADINSLSGINAGERGIHRTDSEIVNVIQDSFWIKQGEQRLLATPRSIRTDQRDGLLISLDYPDYANTAFTVESTLISKLGRGHRQFLSVRDAQKSLIDQALLSADNFTLQVRYQAPSGSTSLFTFLQEGIQHIWVGYDHILFLITLLLPAVLIYEKGHWRSETSIRSATINTLKIVTAFTVAHSITLSLAALDIINFPARLTESVIALSVILAALNNLYPLFSNSRWLLAFLFGLIHGFGFAGVLADLSLPDDTLFTSLLGFNLGVEVGQIAIVLVLLPILYLLRGAVYYRGMVLRAGSAAAIVIASLWLYERVFNVQIMTSMS